MALIYVDTNVFIDAVTGRSNKYGKNLGDPAMRVFHDSILCKHSIVVSKLTLEELFRKVDPREIEMLFQMIKKKIIRIEYSNEDIENAKRLNPDHFQDALHGIIAVKAGAECIVTRNISDFACVSHLIKAKLPEQV